jgi:hypothetical protein
MFAQAFFNEACVMLTWGKWKVVKVDADVWCVVGCGAHTVTGVLEEHLNTTAETGKAVLKQTAQGLAQTPNQIFQMLGAGPR